MPSIHDVARKAQVSTATVSRSFRSPELLSAETHLRVVEAARELNYQPRPSRIGGEEEKEAEKFQSEKVQSEKVQSEKVQSEKVQSVGQEAIGFQFFSDRESDKSQLNAFYAPMLMGAQQEAASCGFNLLIHTTDRNRLTQELPKMVSERSVDGLLLVGASNNAELLAELANHIPHIVLLDDHDPNWNFECVVSDGFGGMYKATQLLLDLGHRRIGFYLAEAEVHIYQDRMQGYASALLDAGIAPDPQLIVGRRLEDSFESRELRLTNLLAKADRPTALLVANDDHALYVMRILRRMGLRAPDDISLIGFDDAVSSLHSDPPLTTVQIDKEAMGRLAAKRLISRICAPHSSVQYPVVNKVSTSLIIRQSCRSI